ncbi:MAG: hypothetical protein LBF55_07220 [Prevotellaceae bacterium]|jgi:hypothetical protein|nr:hypothetical protein [Prevotellaceae bacterium]
MKTKNMFCRLPFFLLSLVVGLTVVACSPAEDNSYALGGEIVALPADWTVTAVDNDNEVVVTYAPLGDFIDGTNVLAVQFNCAEAGINFVVKKDDPVAPKSAKVYRSGNYVLYVAAITRAGAGTPREVPFTVTKNLILETLSEATLADEKEIGGKTFRYTDFYIEKNSYITLSGALANDDVLLNLDFFKRIATDQAQFLGESSVYTLYYSEDVKLITLGVPEPDYPDYLIALGKNFGYPVKTGEPLYIGAYPQYGTADNILQYVLFRKTGDKTFQATVMMTTSQMEFKAFHAAGGGNLTNNWGNGGEYNYANCTFSGEADIFILEGTNWGAGSRVDAAQPYRVTVAITSDGDTKTANVNVQAVDFNGEVVDIPDEPETPPVVDDPSAINFAAFANTTISNEKFGTLEKHLDKDSTYTLVGSFDDADALFNVDFFERVSSGKVKFLGEDGDYTLYYNKDRKHVILGVSGPSHPSYLVITGNGLGYPSMVDGMNEHTGWGFDNVRSYILCRKTGDNIYQTTVYITNEDWAAFKIYQNTSWGGEKGQNSFTSMTGVQFEQAGSGDLKDFKPPTSMAPGVYRMTIDWENNTLNTQPFTLP